MHQHRSAGIDTRCAAGRPVTAGELLGSNGHAVEKQHAVADAEGGAAGQAVSGGETGLGGEGGARVGGEAGGGAAGWLAQERTGGGLILACCEQARLGRSGE